jgi:hypothetical protein
VCERRLGISKLRIDLNRVPRELLGSHERC